MDRSAVISSVLFTALCNDLDVSPDKTGTRFDPFPFGLPTGLDTTEYAKHAILCSIFRKTEVESSDDAEASTFLKFRAANDYCGKVTREDLYEVDNPAVGFSIATARELLYEWFDNHPGEPVSMASIEVAAQFGPGRSVGLKDKPSLLYFKVGDSIQTASSDFIRSWYEQSVRYNPLCEAAEMARTARHGRALIESSGNLTFVPKAYASRRIVVTEPSLNTYFQLGLGRVMERVLQEVTGVSLSTQPLYNQKMAEMGSRNDGTFCTMDLQQCSDYISIALAEFMFPPALLRWMKILRTGFVKPPKQYGREEIPLHMLSTMGNGFTFPMQTVLLSALVLGVYDTLGIQVDRKDRNWGVFGDDIIVVSEAFSLLSQVLAQLGLKVNFTKSFSSGPFRESCGADFYSGSNVRGVYLKRYSSDPDLLSAFNRLAVWSARHDVSIHNTLCTILGFMEGKAVLVPPDEPVYSGILSPEPPRECSENGVWSYTAYTPTIDSFSLEPWEAYSAFEEQIEGSKAKSRRMKKWLGDLRRLCQGSLNEPAVLKVLLAGGIRRNKIVLRQKVLKFRSCLRASPRWGFVRDGWLQDLPSHVFERWIEIIRLIAISKDLE